MSDFQSGASKDGAHYHKQCVEALERYGFTFVESNLRVPDCGVDVDIVARNTKGMMFLIECKGGYEVGRKVGGFKSSDNVRKAIASAFCLSQSETHTGFPWTPLMVMTTYITNTTSENYKQLSVVQTQLMLDVVCDRDAQRLKMWARADYAYIEGHMRNYPTVNWSFIENPYWRIPVGVPDNGKVAA